MIKEFTFTDADAMIGKIFLDHYNPYSLNIDIRSNYILLNPISTISPHYFYKLENPTLEQLNTIFSYAIDIFSRNSRIVTKTDPKTQKKFTRIVFSKQF